MLRSDFHFDLPDELIARFPLPERSQSRLLCLSGDSGQVQHAQFRDLLNLIHPGDLLIFNQSRVMPARLFARKDSGGQVEILIERLTTDRQALAHVRASKSPKPGSKIVLADGSTVLVHGRVGDLFELHAEEHWRGLLARLGEMPLPPYLARAVADSDRERYQTVYAQEEGSVAAPTAGLHFDEAMLEEITARGINTAFVTLHVGAGTFQPVRVDQIDQHYMHAEWLTVDESVVAAINTTKANGGRVVAVGTTSVRSIESAAWAAQGINPAQWQPKQGLAEQQVAEHRIAPYQGDTRIFIHPGYQWQIIDALVTNFHLPESTLLMLVSAFAGREAVLAAYAEAIREQYRFYSYGDAMFITREKS